MDVADVEHRAVPPSNEFVGKGYASSSEQPSGAPGLPTVLLKLAQRIRNLEFIAGIGRIKLL